MFITDSLHLFAFIWMEDCCFFLQLTQADQSKYSLANGIPVNDLPMSEGFLHGLLKFLHGITLMEENVFLS